MPPPVVHGRNWNIKRIAKIVFVVAILTAILFFGTRWYIKNTASFDSLYATAGECTEPILGYWKMSVPILGDFLVYDYGKRPKFGYVACATEFEPLSSGSKIIWFADKDSFIALNQSHAKDSERAYYQNEKISQADPLTFSALAQHYSADEKHVFYSGVIPSEGWVVGKILDGVSPSDVRVVNSELDIVADRRNLFCNGEAVDGAFVLKRSTEFKYDERRQIDPLSFEIKGVGYGTPTFYAIDNQNVYYGDDECKIYTLDGVQPGEISFSFTAQVDADGQRRWESRFGVPVTNSAISRGILYESGCPILDTNTYVTSIENGCEYRAK